MSTPTQQDSSATEYTISDLAAEFEVTPRTLRWYEDAGLLSPGRRGSHRIYAPRDRTRLRLILRGKRIGFTLAEIREIIDMYDAAPGEHGQLNRLLERIEARRRELERRRSDIDRTLDELDALEHRATQRLDEISGR